MLFTRHPFNPSRNATHFQSEEYSQMVAEAQNEPGWEKRLAMYRDLTKFVEDEAFILPMASRVITAAMRKNVEGFVLTRLGFPKFENVSLG